MAVSTHLQIDLGEYDARIRTFIPRYEEMLDRAVAALRDSGGSPSTVVDLGTGTGALMAKVGKVLTRARLVGIDKDEGMLAMAARRLPGRRTTLVLDSFLNATLPRCDAVTASFALHHVEHRRTKAALYRRIRAALRRRGVLVSADCHPASHPALAAAGRASWLDHLAATYGRRKAEGFLRAARGRARPAPRRGPGARGGLALGFVCRHRGVRVRPRLQASGSRTQCLSTRPGRAPVCALLSTTSTPFTSTKRTPSE
jgi:SAM-dependent methyltransferase